MAITETYGIDKDWGTLTNPLIHELENKNGISGTAIDALRSQALDQFVKANVPGRKQEDWKYTPLRDLLKTSFVHAAQTKVSPDLVAAMKKKVSGHCVVLINGHYAEEYSDPMPDGVTLTIGAHMLDNKNSDAILRALQVRLDKVSMTPFEALATSVAAPGVCMLVSPDAQITKPIHFVHLSSAGDAQPAMAYMYKLISVGTHASVDFLESFISVDSSDVFFNNSVNHILVDRGAYCALHRLQDESKTSYHINMTRVFQEQDSTFTSVAAELGSKIMRNNIEVVHRGTNALTNLFGVFMATDRQHSDTQSFIDHAEPHCESHELYKGILDEYARGVFNGKIIVRPDAQKTNAFQQNSTLLLSRNAIMDSKPQLEIFADDVKCSHGATIGQLDEDAIFYLRSRGLSKAEASGLLQRAFVGEVLDKGRNEEITAYFHNILEARS